MGLKPVEKLISGTKVLIYGEAGTRKSRFALTFPNNIYIDSDQGADMYFEEFGHNLVQASDSTTYSEIIDDLDDLERLDEHFDTITLDSITKIYENQQHVGLNIAEQRAISAGRIKEAEGLSTKEWGKIKLNSERLLSKLFEFKKEGKNIVIISESKDVKESFKDASGNTMTKKVGTTPNSSKGLEYDLDLVLETVKDEKTGVTIGVKVIKDRLGVTQEGSIIENPTYDIWKEAIEKRQKGTKKAIKRDMDKDLKHDEESFVPEDPKDLIDQIMAKIKKMNETQKNDLKVLIEKKYGTAEFQSEKDITKLKDILQLTNK